MPPDQVRDVTQLLHAWSSGDRTVLDNLKVRVYGDAAIVTGRAIYTASLEGVWYTDRQILFTDVFIRRNGQWQETASQSTVVAAQQKKQVPMKSTLIVIAIALLLPTVAGAQTWTVEQQELWRLEEQQWKMAAAKDLTWIETMVHPSAVVWGNEFPAPQNRTSLSRWGRYSVQNTTTLEQELFPIAIQITGSVAVVHYRYRVAQENAKKEREIVTGRYTDVFIRDGNRWLFITWAGGDDPKQQ